MSTRYVEPDGGLREQKVTWALGRGRRIGTLDVPEVGVVSAQLADDVVPWGSLAAVQDGPSVGDPLWGWYASGDVTTLESDDGATPITFVTLDESAASLLIGGAGVSLTLASPTVTGTLTTAASVVGAASLIVPHGTAPTGGALIDGSVWSTTAGFFGRVNGVTGQFAVGVIGPTQGGTGLTTYAAGDMLYASAANTLAALAIGGSVGSFIRRIAGNAPSWSTLTLPNTLAAGRVLITTGTDIVGGLAPTANRVLVADGSTATFTTLPSAAMPTGTGALWNPGIGQIITMSQRTECLDGIKVSGAYGLSGTTPANARSITGSRGGNAALASLLTQGAAHGLWVDNTTA